MCRPETTEAVFEPLEAGGSTTGPRDRSSAVGAAVGGGSQADPAIGAMVGERSTEDPALNADRRRRLFSDRQARRLRRRLPQLEPLEVVHLGSHRDLAQHWRPAPPGTWIAPGWYLYTSGAWTFLGTHRAQVVHRVTGTIRDNTPRRGLPAPVADLLGRLAESGLEIGLELLAGAVGARAARGRKDRNPWNRRP